MAQLELQQKSLQAQNEILSKVGWATASDKGGGPDSSPVFACLIVGWDHHVREAAIYCML